MLIHMLCPGCPAEGGYIRIDGRLVADGWNHFLASLAAYAERGAGTPFGA